MKAMCRANISLMNHKQCKVNHVTKGATYIQPKRTKTCA